MLFDFMRLNSTLNDSVRFDSIRSCSVRFDSIILSDSIQVCENELVLKELELLEEDSKVFKLIGPVLVVQELVEVKSNVSKRIDYINADMQARTQETLGKQQAPTSPRGSRLMPPRASTTSAPTCTRAPVAGMMSTAAPSGNRNPHPTPVVLVQKPPSLVTETSLPLHPSGCRLKAPSRIAADREDAEEQAG